MDIDKELEELLNDPLLRVAYDEAKLIDIDQKTGKFKLSRRVLIEKPADYVERPARERRPRPERGDRNDRRDRGERRDFHNDAPANDAPADNFKSALDDIIK